MMIRLKNKKSVRITFFVQVKIKFFKGIIDIKINNLNLQVQYRYVHPQGKKNSNLMYNQLVIQSEGNNESRYCVKFPFNFYYVVINHRKFDGIETGDNYTEGLARFLSICSEIFQLSLLLFHIIWYYFYFHPRIRVCYKIPLCLCVYHIYT